jgi:hypothetical protein
LEEILTGKRILSIALALMLLSGLSSAAAAEPAGSAGDPLISKSYIDNSYPNAVLTGPLNTLADAMTVLKYKLSQLSPSSGGAGLALAMPGGTLSLSAGSGFTLVFGSARLASSEGTFLDLTEGISVAPGQSLSAGHRYLAAENTKATVSIITGTKLALLGSVTLTSDAPPPFTDVTDTMWHYTYVCYAAKKDLVNGRTATLYVPDANLSIAEAIKLAACMHQLYNTGGVTLANDPSVWYKSYVDYASSNGITTKTYTDYNASITRSEFVAIFYAALPQSEYTQLNSVADNAIPDVKTGAANADRIYAFYRAGILTGSDGRGNFLPNTNIKRSEVATIVTRMFEKDARQSITL